MSAYKYCAGDPVHAYDPTGLVADYSGTGKHTALNHAVNVYHRTKSKKIRRAAYRRALRQAKIERQRRLYHMRMLKKIRAAEKRAKQLRDKRRAERLRAKKLAKAVARNEGAKQFLNYAGLVAGGLGIAVLCGAAVPGLLIGAAALTVLAGAALVAGTAYSRGKVDKKYRDEQLATDVGYAALFAATAGLGLTAGAVTAGTTAATAGRTMAGLDLVVSWGASVADTSD